MQNLAFQRAAGLALMIAGVLTFLINACLTPFLPIHAPAVQIVGSSVFVWRQSLSAVVAVLLLFGSVGLYLLQATKGRAFCAVAFALAFVGSALLLAQEWTEIFLIRDLARRAPDALRTLDGGSHPNLYDFGAIIPLGTFTIGWIALAICTLRTRIPSRLGASLLIAGFVAISMLGAAFGVWGSILGNAILASGWIWLGYRLRGPAAQEPEIPEARR